MKGLGGGVGNEGMNLVPLKETGWMVSRSFQCSFQFEFPAEHRQDEMCTTSDFLHEIVIHVVNAATQKPYTNTPTHALKSFDVQESRHNIAV